eukprot:5934636-Lingulodinium_polyedra.AAC.1
MERVGRAICEPLRRRTAVPKTVRNDAVESAVCRCSGSRMRTVGSTALLRAVSNAVRNDAVESTVRGRSASQIA